MKMAKGKMKMVSQAEQHWVLSLLEVEREQRLHLATGLRREYDALTAYEDEEKDVHVALVKEQYLETVLVEKRELNGTIDSHSYFYFCP